MKRKSWEEPPQFSAKDLGALANITHRQLNDWEAKGLFHATRKTEGGWRKFTATEVLALMVCSQIRKDLGVPLPSMQWLLKSLTKKPRRSPRDSEMLPLHTNDPVYLLTDLKSILRVGTLSSIGGFERLEFLRIKTPESFVLLNLTPLLKRLISRLDLSLGTQGSSPDKANHYLSFVWDDREQANG